MCPAQAAAAVAEVAAEAEVVVAADDRPRRPEE